jgi:hypothetical protein
MIPLADFQTGLIPTSHYPYEQDGKTDEHARFRADASTGTPLIRRGSQ